MTRITDMRGDLQAESSGWLFKSTLAKDRGIIVAVPLELVYLSRSAAAHNRS